VYAIENEPEHLDCIRQNIARYATPNVQVVQGAAPSVLADLAAPSAVFLGGTGGAVEAILAAIAQRAQPGCRLVASFILLENVTRALAVAEERGWPFEMIQAQISLGEAHGTETRLAPHSEAFILSATLGGAETFVKQDA
jgi:precorrin-6Y C5,15-methyltransferase (decarboxylating)